MPAGRLISIPFALGADEGTAPRELPAGPFREVVNVRQRRGSAFGMRPDYPAALMTEFDGTLTPYDLYNLNGRLFALGNRQSLVTPSPTDMFEYVEQPGGAWKGTLPVGGTGVRVPGATALRSLGAVPDQISSIRTARVAANNGFVCVAYGDGSITVGATSYVHIFRASTDSTILIAPVTISNAKVVAVGNSFWIVGVDSASDLVGYRFDTTADDDLQSPVTLFTGTVTSSRFDLCDVFDIPVAQFVAFARNGAGVTRILRFNEAGSVQASFAGPAISPDIMVVEADGDANRIVIGTRVGAADVNLSTYNLTTNALVAGPTAVFGEAVTGDLSIVSRGLGVDLVNVISEDATDRILFALVPPTTAVTAAILPVHGYSMGGVGVYTPLGTMLPVISGTGTAPDSNQLLMHDALSTTLAFPLVQVDDGIANPITGEVAKGGQVCQDRVSGVISNPYYWTRILEGTDGQAIMIASELLVASQARRQAAQVESLLFVSGALPLSFDGRQAVECGFLERPTFQSSTPSAGGALIPGAEYDYVAVFKWTDGQNRLTQGPVSEIQTVTMGASDNIVTHLIYAPHTLRKDSNSGTTATVSLYRTENTRLQTTAAVTSVRDLLNDPVSDLNGLTILISVNGAAAQTVTFTAGDDTIDEIIDEINADTTGLVASISDDGHFIVLTCDTAGSGGSIEITGGTATTPNTATFAGFVVGQFSQGTTSHVKGSIFHLAESAIVPLADDLGEPITIIDNTSDTDLISQEPLYTQGEQGSLTGILEHEAPGPCRYCWTVGSRVFIGGLADPSEVAISKELAPAEGLAFSNNLAFRARLEGDVTAVAGLDGVPIAFTADRIYRFSRELPNDQGADGSLGPPILIPSEGGCEDWRSILETSLGLFYKARDGKLMLLPRGNVSPIWIGQAVRDTLESFPDIMATAYVDEDHCALFLCRNSAGTASTILVFDLRLNTWYRDTFASAQVIRAATNYLGRLAYIDTATVRLQSSSLVPATFIEYNVKTGSIEPFGGNGWGKLISITASGEFRGNCQVRLRISYDDGVSFTLFSSVFTLTTATYTAGDTFTCQWWPAVRKCSGFVLDFQVLTNGTATAGVILNKYTLEVIGPPVGRIRTSSAERR